MLAIDTSGVGTYVAWLEKQPARIVAELCWTYREWAVAIHAEIAMLTPQWSGNLAANWAIDLNSPSTTAEDLGDETVSAVHGRGPYSRGMLPAVGYSLDRGLKFGMPSLSSDIYIHNPVTYAEEVETDTGTRPIRAINRIPRTETGKIAMVIHAYTKHSQNGQALLDELRSRSF